MSFYDTLPFWLAIALEFLSPLVGLVERRYLSDELKKRYPRTIGEDEAATITLIVQLQEDRARFFIPYLTAVLSFLLIFLADDHHVVQADVVAIIVMIVFMIVLRLVLEIPDPFTYDKRFRLPIPILREYSYVSLATLLVNAIILGVLYSQIPSNAPALPPAASPTTTAAGTR